MGDEGREREPLSKSQLWDLVSGALERTPVQLGIVDAEHNLLYSNRSQGASGKCHQSIHGRDEPCDRCGLQDSIRDGVTVTMSNKDLGQRTDVVFMPLPGEGGGIDAVLRLQVEGPGEMGLDEALDAVLEANQKLHLLSSIIRHDMLNQLTAMMGYLDLYDDIPEKRDIVIPRMRELVQNLGRQVRFTRSYQKLGSSPPEWQDCEQCLRRAAEELGMEPDLLRMEGPLPSVFTDHSMENVVSILLSNSLMHARGLSAVRVWFEDGEEGGSLFLADDGQGIPEEEKERIFQRAYGENLGYGLFLARTMLDIGGMTIREVGKEGQGACFRLDLPPRMYRHRNGSVKE